MSCRHQSLLYFGDEQCVVPTSVILLPLARLAQRESRAVTSSPRDVIESSETSRETLAAPRAGWQHALWCGGPAMRRAVT